MAYTGTDNAVHHRGRRPGVRRRRLDALL